MLHRQLFVWFFLYKIVDWALVLVDYFVRFVFWTLCIRLKPERFLILKYNITCSFFYVSIQIVLFFQHVPLALGSIFVCFGLLAFMVLQFFFFFLTLHNKVVGLCLYISLSSFSQRYIRQHNFFSLNFFSSFPYKKNYFLFESKSIGVQKVRDPFVAFWAFWAFCWGWFWIF